MSTYSGSCGSYFTLYLDVTLNSQDISANTSSVHWVLSLVNTGSRRTSYESNAANNDWGIDVGSGSSGNTTFDFRSTTYNALASGDKTITHDADGSKALAVSAYFTERGTSSVQSGSLSGTYYLPTIPRASESTVSPGSADAGTSVTITTNRASSGFTHEIDYSFGAASGSVGTGIGASTTWTPPLSLLSEIPNAVSGTVTLTTRTYNGATLIGSKTTTFTLTVPSSVVPSFTSVTHSENVSLVASVVGAYVQGLTKLDLAITGAAGAYGSTISAYKITAGTQTINSVSGTTPATLAVSGTVSIVGLVTDSRGRTATATVNVTVLPYIPPAIDTGVLAFSRATSGGVVATDGTYIRVDLKADVQSLIVSSTEKNELTYSIYTKLRGAGSWTLKKSVTPGGISFNSNDLVSTFAVEDSFDVRVDVSDEFITASVTGTISTSAVFMHWGGPGEGLGVGKFWEQGGVDVLGQVYHNEGEPVASVPSADLADGVIPTWDSSTGRYEAGTGSAGTLSCGMYIDWPTVAPLPDYLLTRNGAAVSRTVYATLFGLIGTTFGVGDGSTTFNLPDSTEEPVFYVDATSTQALGTSTWTTLTTTWGTPAYNEDFTSWASGILTIKKAGWYLFNLHIQPSVSTALSVGLFVNNSLEYIGGSTGTTGNNTLLRYMAAGDNVRTKGYSTGGGTTITNSTHFAARYLGRSQEPDSTPTIVATDQGLGVTVINGGAGGLALGMIVAMGGDAAAPIPAQCLEMNGQSVLAATYSGLAAMYPSWVSGANLILPDMRGRAMVGAAVKSSLGTTTMTIASPGVVTLAAHGRAAGQRVSFTTTGALPTGLTVGTRYFVRDVTATTFKLATTLNGTAINTSGSQSGVHTLWDEDFTALGEVVGETAHTLIREETPNLAINIRRMDGDANDYLGGSGAAYGITTPYTVGGIDYNIAYTGGGDAAHYNVQKSYVGRWLVVASDSAGEYSPTVQAALVGRVGTLEGLHTAVRPRVKAGFTSSSNAFSSFDTVTMFGGFTNPVANKFVVPKTGTYQINASQLISPSGALYMALYINGVGTYHAYSTGGMGDLHINIVRDLVAGDEIQIKMNGNITTAWNGAHCDFTMVMLGE